MSDNIEYNYKKGDFVKMLSNNKIYVIMSNGRVSDTSKNIIYTYISFELLVKRHPSTMLKWDCRWFKYVTEDRIQKLSEEELPYSIEDINLCKSRAEFKTNIV